MNADRALRTGALIVEAMPGYVAQVTGDGAYDAVDAFLAGSLRVRDGRMQTGIWLDTDARPLADVLVARDRDDFWLVLEAAPAFDAVAAIGATSGVRVESLADTHVRIGVHGPFAWELMLEAASPGIFGMPYQTHMDLGDDGVVFRASKTGEFGYDWLVSKLHHGATVARLVEAAARLGMEEGIALVSPDEGARALDRAALENGFFSIRHAGVTALTPVELQLQVRVSRRKAFVGREALLARLADGARRRVATITSDAAPVPGTALVFEGQAAGSVLTGDWSEVLASGVGLAVLDEAVAWPGLTFSSPTGETFRTASPPLLDNRSLQLDLQRHTFRSQPGWAPFRRPT